MYAASGVVDAVPLNRQPALDVASARQEAAAVYHVVVGELPFRQPPVVETYRIYFASPVELPRRLVAIVVSRRVRRHVHGADRYRRRSPPLVEVTVVVTPFFAIAETIGDSTVLIVLRRQEADLGGGKRLVNDFRIGAAVEIDPGRRIVVEDDNTVAVAAVEQKAPCIVRLPEDDLDRLVLRHEAGVVVEGMVA